LGAMEFLRSKRQKHTSFSPARLTELTLVARFPSPWHTNDPDEAKATLQKGRWHPSSVDFVAVATTPNLGQRSATTVFHAGSVDELIVRICYKDSDSANPKVQRPDHNLGRINIITHGNDGVIALSGKLDKSGHCHLGDPDPNNPRFDQRIDGRTLEWFNTDKIGRAYRNMIRQKLHRTAEIWLVMCNGACIGKSFELARELANTFGVTVRGYTQEVWYSPDPSTEVARLS
jgi:hypothetical protein